MDRGRRKSKETVSLPSKGQCSLAVHCRGEMGGQLDVNTEVWALLMEPRQRSGKEMGEAGSGLTLAFSMRDWLDKHSDGLIWRTISCESHMHGSG